MAATSTSTTITQPIEIVNEFFKIKQQKDEINNNDDNYFDKFQ
jgi:hypothetical protein